MKVNSQNKLSKISIWALMVNIFAVVVLGVVALSWIYSIESVLLRAFLELTILPSIAAVVLNLFFPIYLMIKTKKFKIALIILLFSLGGIALMFYLEVIFP